MEPEEIVQLLNAAAEVASAAAAVVIPLYRLYQVVRAVYELL